jgi:hypothetical protein
MRVRGLAVLCGAAVCSALLGPAAAHAESILLSWTAPGDDGDVGVASTYELRYSATPVPGTVTSAWWNQATSPGSLPAPLTAGTRESFLVTGLAPATTYYFVLRTADEVPNWSDYSNISVRQTSGGGGGSSLATAADFRAQAVTGGALLRWSAVTGGTALGYHLYRRTLPDTTAGLLATIPLATTAYTDTTARGGETYEFRLVTFDDAAEGAPALASISLPGDLLATATALHGYPNPARGHATLRFDVAGSAGGHVRVTIFDLTGRRVCTLFDGTLPAGAHSLDWACRSDRGSSVAPGLYNVILDGPGGRRTTHLAVAP